MYNNIYATKASEYLHKICSVKPNRHTGSQGNKDATIYFAEIVKKLGYSVDTEVFSSLDYKTEQVSLTLEAKNFTVYNSPYSLGCDIKAELVTVSSVEELES